MSKYLKILLLLPTIVSVIGSPAHFNEEIAKLEDEKKSDQVEQPRIYRLTEEVEPLNYVLRMEPNLTDFTFSGKVEIDILVKFSTNQVTLHSRNLTIKSCKVKIDTQFIDNKFTLDEINDLLIVESAQQLKYDTKYTLVMEFEATLSDDMTGFYKSSYTINNKER